MLRQSIIFNASIVLCALLGLLVLFRPRVLSSVRWRATVTPLASIIGSGFLVVAPLLHHIVDGYAVYAMIFVVFLAYGLGAIVRYNIRYVEPLLSENRENRHHRFLRLNELVADAALAVSYLISVAFYLRLMASFLLLAISSKDPLMANIVTTGFLLFILIFGLARGLKGLERLEEIAVSIKLSIIAALLFGLLVFDVGFLLKGVELTESFTPHDPVQTLRLLGSVLLIVQGFETSRYLGSRYDAQMRVKSMRDGQLLAGLIYIAFVLLALPAMSGFEGAPSETAIIDLSSKVAVALPILLIVAAVMSQFSAAVADTAGGGGLIEEATVRRVKSRLGYAIVCVIAIVIVWSANIFEIISFASRAFALFYGIQCVSAILATRNRDMAPMRKRAYLGFFSSLGILMLLVTLFSIPAVH